MYERRRRRYFALMTVSLTLFISASLLVRLFSVPLAVGMCVVAAVLPPIAAVVANRREPDETRWDDPPPPPPPAPGVPAQEAAPSARGRTRDEELWEQELRSDPD